MMKPRTILLQTCLFVIFIVVLTSNIYAKSVAVPYFDKDCYADACSKNDDLFLSETNTCKFIPLLNANGEISGSIESDIDNTNEFYSFNHSIQEEIKSAYTKCIRNNLTAERDIIEKSANDDSKALAQIRNTAKTGIVTLIILVIQGVLFLIIYYARSERERNRRFVRLLKGSAGFLCAIGTIILYPLISLIFNPVTFGLSSKLCSYSTTCESVIFVAPIYIIGTLAQVITFKTLRK